MLEKVCDKELDFYGKARRTDPLHSIAHGDDKGRVYHNEGEKCTSHERVRKSPSEFKKLKRIELELNASEQL